MAEKAQDSKEASQPPFDPGSLLGQLKELVKEKTKDGDGKAKTGTSWLWSLILPILVLVGIGIFAWYSQRHNRELAKLRHEKNKAKIIKEQTELFVEINKNDVKVAEAQKQIDASRERLRIVEADIKAEESRYEANMRAIDSISSWADAGIR